MMPTVSTPSLSASSAGRPRVLVADDSRVIRSAIKKILDGDFEVVVIESGDAAWEMLAREGVFQMLITDIEMPGMDGYELICRIRGSDGAWYKDIPILTITGADDEQTKERAFACGATDFITKPIDPIQLKARVQSYVRIDQSARDLAEKATQLEDQSVADPLTGLRSRRYFLQRGEQDIAFCVRNDKDLSVIRFDIDRYKEIYRKYGDDVGDRILIWLAGVVSANARVEDTVARVAGAKLAILATATGIEEAKLLCQRIRDATHATPFLNDGDVILITLSFGLASMGQDHTPRIEDLLKYSEERVNRALTDGGDRICVSVIGEAAPDIEEVVLGMPVLAEAPPPEVVAPPAAPESMDFEVPGISVLSDSADTGTLPDLPLASPVDSVAQLLSVDKALQLIANGDEQLIAPYLKALKEQLRPLLDLIARNEDRSDSSNF